MESLAILIPARAGSKGLKNKNFRLFDGLPLITWTIQHAISLDLREATWISTDCPTCQVLGEELGVRVTSRPSHLASDGSMIKDAIKHWIQQERIMSSYKYFMLLQGTYPLRLISDIERAFELIKKYGYTKVVSVRPVTEHPSEMIVREQVTGRGEMLIPSMRNTNRQSYLQDCFFITGSFYISEIAAFLEDETFFDSQTHYLVTKEPYAIDIDLDVDFELAEMIHRIHPSYAFDAAERRFTI